MITKDYRLTNEEVAHRQSVRNTYKTPEGKAELLRMLVDFGLFRQIEEPDLALRNYAIHKLEEMGFLDIEVIGRMIDWLFTQPLAYRPTVEERGMDIEKDPFNG